LLEGLDFLAVFLFLDLVENTATSTTETADISAGALIFFVLVVCLAVAGTASDLMHDIELATQGPLSEQDHVALIFLLQLVVDALEVN
jgi:hypothetical protein